MRKSRLLSGTFIFFLNLLLNLSCSEEPTKPSEETNGGNNGFTLESSINIGIEGGTVSSNEFSLTVPAGSFKQQTEIMLYSKEDTTLFGEDTATKLFRLEGLPLDFTTPLRVALEYNKILTNESVISSSEDFVDEFTEETGTIYDMSDAVDSSGYLVGYLKPTPNDANIFPKLSKNNSRNRKIL